MVVKAVLDQGGKKGLKRVVQAFGGTKTGENLGFGVCVPSRTFFFLKICDPFEEKQRLFGSGPAP